MNILLKNEQIQEMRELQRVLDERIRENNGIDKETDLNLEKYIALKTELFEFVNEIESFKYWKKNKGKAHILEEACDTLHFILSLAIDNDVELEMDENSVSEQKLDEYNLNDLIGITDAMISDTFISGDWKNLEGVLTFLCVILKICGFDPDDLYNAYISKNKVNHKRQDNNY